MSYATADNSTMVEQIAQQFDRAHLDETECRLLIARILKPSPICPKCQVSLSDPERARLYAGKNLICSCGTKHSLRSGTHINGIHCDYREIVLVAAMNHWNVPVDAISRATHISTSTVRRLVERFQYANLGY